MMAKIKKLVPQSWFNYYHKTLAVLANFCYGRPSQQLIVIGVTGTNGKTSTCSYIAQILMEAGNKVGVASTALFRVGDEEWLNDKKMTMLGRFALQKLMRRMVSAGCQYAIIETSSQGISQFRHLGIHYDVCVFTNLTPEHIEAHGGFDNYKSAKLKLFKHLENQKIKKSRNLPTTPEAKRWQAGQEIKKSIIVNGDDNYAKEFLDFKIDEKITFGIESDSKIKAENISYNTDGVSFKIDNEEFNLKLFGKFNIYNSLAAIAVVQSQGIDSLTCKKALEKITVMPGRMEFIETSKDYKVLVDYAPEPESMKQLFETIKLHNLVAGKIIHVFGSCGGGRDVSRRPILGELSAKNAEIQIITNEDPYDDDPNTIIEQVALGAIKSGKVLNENLFKIIDRREAIKFALSLAKAGDLVLLTGKGCEQAICVANGCKLQWDEREVVRALLA